MSFSSIESMQGLSLGHLIKENGAGLYQNHLGSFLVAICHSDIEMSLQKLVKIMSKTSQKINDLLLSKYYIP